MVGVRANDDGGRQPDQEVETFNNFKRVDPCCHPHKFSPRGQREQ
jgi:hypothetical protein